MNANQPTNHPPGSPGKVEVLGQRAALGLPLFHPGDAVDGDWTPTAGYFVGTRGGESQVEELLADPGSRRLLLAALREGTDRRRLARDLGAGRSVVFAALRRLRAAG